MHNIWGPYRSGLYNVDHQADIGTDDCHDRTVGGVNIGPHSTCIDNVDRGALATADRGLAVDRYRPESVEVKPSPYPEG